MNGFDWVRGRPLRAFFVSVEDFPYGAAGQNSGHHWREKSSERKRNRTMGKMIAVDRLARFPDSQLEGRLRMEVVAHSPMRDDLVHDTINLPAMLKGYFDGFTDAGVWGDDRQVCHLDIMQFSGEPTRLTYPRGFLTFLILEVIDAQRQ